MYRVFIQIKINITKKITLNDFLFLKCLEFLHFQFEATNCLEEQQGNDQMCNVVLVKTMTISAHKSFTDVIKYDVMTSFDLRGLLPRC